ncbi:MAG: Holliday junction resolvase RuvX [Acidimicrobiales bacterium]
MRALALDLGSKRIGVAISDSAGTLATPVDTVHRGRDRKAAHLRIAELVAEWSAEIVVVGLPLSLDGSLGPAARAALDEADELRAALGVPVVSHDERLTTVTATDRLRELGLRGPRRTAVIDQTAAAVLLQAWLDSRNDQERTAT